MANPTGDSLTFDLKLEDVQPGESVRQYFWNLSQDSMVVMAHLPCRGPSFEGQKKKTLWL